MEEKKNKIDTLKAKTYKARCDIIDGSFMLKKFETIQINLSDALLELQPSEWDAKVSDANDKIKLSLIKSGQLVLIK